MPLPSRDAGLEQVADPHALARSRALANRIVDEIAATDGWIGFDRYMQRALYEPGLGYYSSLSHKFGAAGDFVTGPELSPLFGGCVARQVSQWFDEVPAQVIEFGAGTGALASQVLNGLARLGTPAAGYSIVELSADLRQRQRDAIARDAPEHLHAVRWLDRMPDGIEGVVLGNELLDAMPVRLFEATDERLFEVGVGLDGDGGFAWRLREADTDLRDALDDALARAGVPAGGGAMGLAHAAGGRYRSEIGIQAQAWMATVGRTITRGAVLLIDYGFPAAEYFHPQRSDGTLVCHFRHRVHADPFYMPGLQDITAHVDFSAIAAAATRNRLELLGYGSQARFLIDCGLLDLLQAAACNDGPATEAEQATSRQTITRSRRLAAVQTLLSEAEMGELFKVIAFGRGMTSQSIGFVSSDRSVALDRVCNR